MYNLLFCSSSAGILKVDVDMMLFIPKINVYCHLIKNSDCSLYKLVKKFHQSVKIAQINHKSSTKNIKIQQSIKIYINKYYRLIQTHIIAKRIRTSKEV